MYPPIAPPLLATFDAHARTFTRPNIAHTHTLVYSVKCTRTQTHRAVYYCTFIIYTRTYSHARESTLTTSRMHGTLVANDEPRSGDGRGEPRVTHIRHPSGLTASRTRQLSRSCSGPFPQHTHTRARARTREHVCECVRAFRTCIISPVAV